MFAPAPPLRFPLAFLQASCHDDSQYSKAKVHIIFIITKTVRENSSPLISDSLYHPVSFAIHYPLEFEGIKLFRG